MAFVSAAGGFALRTTSFTGDHALVTRTGSAVRTSSVRMAGLTDKERKSFAKIGATSKWRENLFTGGFPGGEEAFLEWAEKGMKEEVPDLPGFLQPTTTFKTSVDSRATPTVLERAQATEFFKKFTGTKPATAAEPAAGEVFEDAEEPAAEAADEAEAAAAPAPADDAPPEALYAQYYPAATRNLAPEIDIRYNKDEFDRVGMAMTEVTAAASDLHFPAEYSGKAPFIDISYNGNLATASVSVRMGDVAPLPSVAPPVASGDTVTKLVPGAGGGLKLEFEVQGEGPVNVYSDPRCVENFNAMLGK